jgi:hypothetical protein
MENMKYLIAVILLSLTACAQLKKGEMQPVKRIDAKEPIYFTTCSGSVEEWGSCNNKARDTCKGIYEVVNKLESPVGGRRELTFRCNQ